MNLQSMIVIRHMAVRPSNATTSGEPEESAAHHELYHPLKRLRPKS
jgi:hypothetical protein